MISLFITNMVFLSKEDDGRMVVDHNSMTKNSGVIGALLELGFIDEEVRLKFQVVMKLHAHTHMNVTPHIRQHVISELEQDEDLFTWWARCKEIVSWDIGDIKNNEHKFQNT